MKDYFVGIDFGHGETAAWVVPLSSKNDAKIDEIKGESLKLKSTNSVGDRVIASEVYFTPPETYSLEERTGATLFNQMKMEVSNLNQDEDKKQAYKEYIKCVVERLLEQNKFLNKEEPNFLLYMASPTRWGDNEKNAYLKFFNEAISKLNLRFESIIDESDAAFFSKMSDVSDINECTLVIDYGSSTVDYTVMKGGKKISENEWSSKDLGASCIENNMITHAKKQNYQDFTNKIEKANSIAHQQKVDDIICWLQKYCREEKEKKYTKGIDRYQVLESLSSILNNIDDEEDITFNIKGSLNELTKDYREKIKQDLEKLRQKIRETEESKNHDPDNIILSGGASIMKWMNCLVEEVFPNSKPILDHNPAFVVAKGVALYAKAQQEAMGHLMSEIESKNYADMYKKADSDANHQAMCELSGAVVQDIINSAPITGESIRQRFCYFIQGLNPQNLAFSQMVQKKFSDALSFEVGKIIKTAIKQAFRVNADVSNIRVDIPIQVLSWNSQLFVPGGAFYNHIESLIIDSSSRFSFTMEKPRDSSEATEIARGVQKRLKEIDFGSITSYPEEVLAEYGNQLKQIAKAEAYKLFVDKQLFKTTFTA